MSDRGNVVLLVDVPGVAVAVNDVVVGTVARAEGARSAPGHQVARTSRVRLDLARVVWALESGGARPDWHSKPDFSFSSEECWSSFPAEFGFPFRFRYNDLNAS